MKFPRFLLANGRMAGGRLPPLFDILGGLWLLVGFARQTRTSNDSFLGHPLRRRILDALKAHPGASISRLRRMLECKWGTLRHHLYRLERANLLHAVRSGRENHLYLDGAEEAKFSRRLTVLHRGRIPDIIRLILDRPGLMQREITSELAISRKMIREYSDSLKEEGLIIEVAEANTRRYFPTALLQNASSDVHSAEGIPTNPHLLDDDDSPPNRKNNPLQQEPPR